MNVESVLINSKPYQNPVNLNKEPNHFNIIANSKIIQCVDSNVGKYIQIGIGNSKCVTIICQHSKVPLYKLKTEFKITSNQLINPVSKKPKLIIDVHLN